MEQTAHAAAAKKNSRITAGFVIETAKRVWLRQEEWPQHHEKPKKVWVARLRTDYSGFVNLMSVKDTKWEAFSSLVKQAHEFGLEKDISRSSIPSRNVLVVAVDQSETIPKSMESLHTHMEMLLKRLQRVVRLEYYVPKLERRKPDSKLLTIENALQNTRFTTILMDAALGLELGPNRCDDGKVILKSLRDGKYGDLNKSTPVLSIFGDCRLEEPEIVSNNLRLGVLRSGIWQVLYFSDPDNRFIQNC